MTIRIMTLMLIFASMPGCAYWLHPSLHIYGKVVDQDGQPVPDVSVTHAVTRGNLIMGPMEGPASHIDTLTTGRNGEFSVSTRGNGIFLERFEKAGYIFAKGSGQSCYRQYHVPEIAKCPDHMSEETPVIIPAWKKGEPARLIEHGMTILAAVNEHTKRFQLEGVPIEMEVQWNRTGTRGEPLDWSLTLIAIGGGIMANNDAFPYEAPKSGYQSQWTTTSVKGTATWRGGVERKWFYLTAADGKYFGNMMVYFNSFFNEQAKLSIRYSINPNGSRNLLSEKDN